MIVIVDLTSKKAIIDSFKLQLNFPDYCSYNWDSFEECLLDYLDETKEPLHVRHTANIDLISDRQIYRSIMSSVKESYPNVDIDEIR